MQIYYTCPYWGQEHLGAADFIDKVVAEGYHGIEINLPEDNRFIKEFHRKKAAVDAVSKTGFIFIAQQVLPPAKETVAEYIKRMRRRLRLLARLEPAFINSHTGKDFFSFDDNCRVIEAAMNLSVQTSVPVLHETHRGRFSFHAPSMMPYLKRFPEMQLVADFSHWCTVSESLLQEQEELLDAVIPHIGHIHARIGFEQGPQVNDPFAPEWAPYLALFTGWWKKIIRYHRQNKKKQLTISPEFGPVPYMPVLPFTRQPVADQWKLNAGIKDLLKKELQQV